MDELRIDVIAKSNRPTKGRRRRCGKFAVAGLAMLSLSGCMTGGMDVLSSAKVDRSVTTGSIPQAAVTSDSLSDEATVRNAVTSADVRKLGNQALPWANASTGSAGVVDAIVETSASGVTCRQFSTTRHSYGGIGKFYGRTCLADDGNWQLMSFQPQS